MISRYLKYLNKISTVDIDLINCDHDISRDLDMWPLPAVARREAPRAPRADVWLQHLSWSEHCNCAWHGWLKPYEFENCQLPCSNNYLVVIINWQYEEFPLVFSFSRFWDAQCSAEQWAIDHQRKSRVSEIRGRTMPPPSGGSCAKPYVAVQTSSCKILMFCQVMDSP